MRVEITDPAYTDDLVEFLRRCDCMVHVVGEGVLDVRARELPIADYVRRPELEIDAYLGIWSALRGSHAAVAV